MRTLIFTLILFVSSTLSSFAHSITIDANPTSGNVVYGVLDTLGFTSWRAYIRGLSNNGQGTNSDWTNSGNGWWYKNISSFTTKATWQTTGLENQNFEVTYWIFKSNGTWEFGSKTIVTHASLPPPSNIPPTPTNVRAQQSYANNWIYWSDAAGETGYRIYVNDVLTFTLQQNSTVAIHNSGLVSGQTYCYKLSAFNTSGESPKSGASCVAYVYPIPAPDPTPNPEPEPQPEPETQNPPQDESIAESAGFILPLDTAKILRYENSIPDLSWYDYQPFGSLFNSVDRVHLGHDFNLAGSNDYGKPIYAINDCTVVDYSNTTASDGWGKYIALRCDAPTGFTFRLSDNQTVSSVDVLYAHLSEVAIVSDSGIISASSIVRNTTKVKKGWKIGKVGDGNGFYPNASHLHFEIRKSRVAFPGAGYKHYDDLSFLDSHVDALEFISNNAVLSQKKYHIFVHPYNLVQHNAIHVELDKTLWSRKERQGYNERQSMGYGNYLWVTDSRYGTQASWNFEVPQDGKYEMYVYLPRSNATASAVKYTIWHSGNNFANPYILTINQNRNPGKNERFFVGTFQFNAGWGYSVAIAGTSPDLNPKKIAIDALELVFNYNDGFGGGSQAHVDADQDLIDDEWEISYGYSGSNAQDATLDDDDDGLTTLAEYRLSTDPREVDTDGDGFDDGDEYDLYFDPADPNDYPGLVQESEDSSQESEVTDSVEDELLEVEVQDLEKVDADSVTEVVINNNNIMENGFGCSTTNSRSLPIELIALLCIFALIALKSPRML